MYLHLLTRHTAEGGRVSVTADALSDVSGIPKRTVENALGELRAQGLIKSVGSKKNPVIEVSTVLDASSIYTDLKDGWILDGRGRRVSRTTDDNGSSSQP